MKKNDNESIEINYNPNRPYIPDSSCKILVVGGSRSGKN